MTCSIFCQKFGQKLEHASHQSQDGVAQTELWSSQLALDTTLHVPGSLGPPLFLVIHVIPTVSRRAYIMSLPGSVAVNGDGPLHSIFYQPQLDGIHITIGSWHSISLFTRHCTALHIWHL